MIVVKSILFLKRGIGTILFERRGGKERASAKLDLQALFSDGTVLKNKPGGACPPWSPHLSFLSYTARLGGSCRNWNLESMVEGKTLNLGAGRPAFAPIQSLSPPRMISLS